jgi:hypothetical protein
MYSTYHHDDENDPKTGKPVVIADYNRYKWAVDMFDKMQGLYAYDYGTRRWPMKLFMFMVNCSAMNAYSLMKPGCSRRVFMNMLADQLTSAQKSERQRSTHYINATFQKIGGLYDELHNKVRGMRMRIICL